MYTYILIMIIAEGSLEVKLPTIWTDETQKYLQIQVYEKRGARILRRQKMEVGEKVGKSRNTGGFANDSWLQSLRRSDFCRLAIWRRV